MNAGGQEERNVVPTLLPPKSHRYDNTHKIEGEALRKSIFIMCSDILSLLPKYHILHKFYGDDKRKGNSKTNKIEPSRRRMGRGITNELRQYVSLFPAY